MVNEPKKESLLDKSPKDILKEIDDSTDWDERTVAATKTIVKNFREMISEVNKDIHTKPVEDED
jgi:hypothetical protein